MLMKDFQEVKASDGVVVSLSGGLDSSVLLLNCVKNFGNDAIFAVSFNYGQRHVRELTSALAVASFLRVRHKIINIQDFADVARGSSQTDFSVPVPHGHYADASMKTTVVPNRNSIFLNYCVAWAISIGAKTVAYAAHSGDHAIYPDCRPEFAEAIARLFETVHYEPIHLFTPFIDGSKRAIIADYCSIFDLYGDEAQTVVRFSYSCYEGREKHCGKCGTCVERKEAFAGFDPTEYEA